MCSKLEARRLRPSCRRQFHVNRPRDFTGFSCVVLPPRRADANPELLDLLGVAHSIIRDRAESFISSDANRPRYTYLLLEGLARCFSEISS